MFARLGVYYDKVARSAAMNMALDEALWEEAQEPVLRLYRWDHPALSFGYFGRYGDVSHYEAERELVRRWTGGGIVLHGDDLTYSIVIPSGHAAFSESSLSIYENVHRALRDALLSTGQRAIVAAIGDRGAGINDAGYTGHCFANPVRADVLVDGRKIAGAAQRRSRRGLLQQGSIQGVELGEEVGGQFASELSSELDERVLDEKLLARAREIAQQKYGALEWLRRR
jgi:lipoate-protein ligase A